MLFNLIYYKLKMIGRILCEFEWEFGRWIKYEKCVFYFIEVVNVFIFLVI